MLRRTGLRALAPALTALASLFSVTTLAQEAPANLKDYLGPKYEARSAPAQLQVQAATTVAPRRFTTAADTLRYWNQVAVDSSGLDHTPVQAGETRTFGHQLGPGRSSRAMAIVHIAIFDAVNSIVGGYRSYTGIPRMTQPASVDAAIAQAAHDTLIRMFPSHKPRLDRRLPRPRRSRRVATGSHQPVTHRAGLEMGHGATLRPALGYAISRATATGDDQCRVR